MHACDYLLACDMDMDPVPGYAFTSWAKGYGDFRPHPRFRHAARRVVAAEDGARAVRRLSTSTSTSWCRSRRAACCGTSSSAPRSAASRPWRRRSSSSTSSRTPTRRVAEKGFINLRADRPRHRGLPHPPGHEGRAPHRRDPLAPGALRRSGRVVEGRMGAGPAGDRTALRRRAGDGRPPLDLQARGEGDRLAAGPRRHVHGQVGRALRRARAATSTCSLWDAKGKKPLFAGDEPLGPIECSPTFRWFLGGWMKHIRELFAFYAPYPVVVQALRGRLVRADRHRLELRQPHRRLPHRRPADRRCASSAAPPAPTPTPTSPSPPPRRGTRRHREPHRAAAGLRGRRLRRAATSRTCRTR